MSRFLARLTEAPARLVGEPPARLAGAVVIPCHDEPPLTATFASLRRAAAYASARGEAGVVEVIVVVNHSQSAAPAAKANDAALVRWLKEQGAAVLAAGWEGSHVVAGEPPVAKASDSFGFDPVFRSADGAAVTLALQVVTLFDLADKHAGVGVARRAGMDEAARRLYAVGRPDALIMSLDADTEVAENYFAGLWAAARRAKAQALSIHFEHRCEPPTERERTAPTGRAEPPPTAESVPADSGVRAAIDAYELHLRYYVAALRWAGLPWAFHTVGSAFAVRAEGYMHSGGMNERQAGEDFYFLHKFSVRAQLADVVDTAVYPSARRSARTPYGTGQAVARILDGEPQRTYAWRSFVALSVLRAYGDALLDGEPPAAVPEPAALTWWQRAGGPSATAAATSQTTTLAARRARYYQWFTPFLAMKFLHAARAWGWGDVPVLQAVRDASPAWGMPAPPASVHDAVAVLRAQHVARVRSATERSG